MHRRESIILPEDKPGRQKEQQVQAGTLAASMVHTK